MSETNFRAIDRVVADSKLWAKELQDTPVDMPASEQLTWVKNQLQHNVAAFLAGLAKAVTQELDETNAELATQGEVITEIIDQEGDFLRPEMANDLITTFLVGLSIVEMLEQDNIKLSDDLKDRKIKEAIKLYKSNTTILLPLIEEVTNLDEDEEDEGDADDDIHGQSEDSGSSGVIARSDDGGIHIDGVPRFGSGTGDSPGTISTTCEDTESES